MSSLSSHTDTSVYTDLNQFRDLRTQAQQDPDAALKEVAKQFESVFINMLVKSMRQAGEPFASDIGNSNQIKSYQQMFDQQLSLDLAGKGGLGLADIIARQLGGADANSQPEDSTATSSINPTDISSDLSRYRLLATDQISPGSASTLTSATISSADAVQPLVDLTNQAEESNKPLIDISDAGPLFSDTASTNIDQINSPDIKLDSDWLPSSPKEFLESLWSFAKQAGEALKQNPKVILAQAALETGWGQFVASNRDGSNSFNLFGIKSGSAWTGAETEVSTLEYENGAPQRQLDSFRSYSSLADSFKDYVNLLTDNPRYEKAVSSTDDESFVRGLQAGGYATDPNYADKILGILSNPVFDNLGQGK